jgi:Lactonase, 7-bladed beta-propeller
VHPSGKFVYSSNRGHDSLAVFSVTAKDGKLTFVEYAPTKAKTPRGFGIDPSGSYLLAAGQDSDNVVVFRVDKKTGKLTATGQELQVAMPVCVHSGAVVELAGAASCAVFKVVSGSEITTTVPRYKPHDACYSWGRRRPCHPKESRTRRTLKNGPINPALCLADAFPNWTARISVILPPTLPFPRSE